MLFLENDVGMKFKKGIVILLKMKNLSKGKLEKY